MNSLNDDLTYIIDSDNESVENLTEVKYDVTEGSYPNIKILFEGKTLKYNNKYTINVNDIIQSQFNNSLMEKLIISKTNEFYKYENYSKMFSLSLYENGSENDSTHELDIDIVNSYRVDNSDEEKIILNNYSTNNVNYANFDGDIYIGFKNKFKYVDTEVNYTATIITNEKINNRPITFKVFSSTPSSENYNVLKLNIQKLTSRNIKEFSIIITDDNKNEICNLTFENIKCNTDMTMYYLNAYGCLEQLPISNATSKQLKIERDTYVSNINYINGYKDFQNKHISNKIVNNIKYNYVFNIKTIPFIYSNMLDVITSTLAYITNNNDVVYGVTIDDTSFQFKNYKTDGVYNYIFNCSTNNVNNIRR